ncbi:uncharacterized protein LOC109831540 isoform X2 [Asparagus officinalis]|uniref:uncharacterized protein LOC109831540 isoform X2 n=1 Tax=Asparagus officinalis TaxID=4686 RepID=UPI00098E575D|nr:uncharacterized protein LOC109831540 isoform X2 [Asparagus officinalis]
MEQRRCLFPIGPRLIGGVESYQVSQNIHSRPNAFDMSNQIPLIGDVISVQPPAIWLNVQLGNNLNRRFAFWGESILMLPFAILGLIMKPLELKDMAI